MQKVLIEVESLDLMVVYVIPDPFTTLNCQEILGKSHSELPPSCVLESVLAPHDGTCEDSILYIVVWFFEKDLFWW